MEYMLCIFIIAHWKFNKISSSLAPGLPATYLIAYTLFYEHSPKVSDKRSRVFTLKTMTTDIKQIRSGGQGV